MKTTWLCSDAMVDFSVITGAADHVVVRARAHLNRSVSASTAALVSTSVSTAQDVVDVDALDRQHVDVGDVARRQARNSASTSAPSMISALTKPSSANWPASALVFGSLTLASAMTDQLVVARLAGQRMLQRQRPHLLGQIDGMAAHHRPERLAAAAELRRRLVAVAGAARCPSACTSWRWSCGSRRASWSCGCRPAAWRAGSAPSAAGCRCAAQPENLIGQRDRAVRLAVEGGDLVVHHQSASPALGLGAAASAGADAAAPARA